MLVHRRPSLRISSSTEFPSSARFTKLIATSAPSAASASAIARPIPRLEPVTSATFPFKVSICGEYRPSLLADTESREYAIQDVVGGGCAGHGVNRPKGGVEIEQQHFVG